MPGRHCLDVVNFIIISQTPSLGRRSFFVSLNIIFNQKMANKYHQKNIAEPHLSNKELEWLEKHGTVRVGYLRKTLAYCDEGSDGKPIGVLGTVFANMEQRFHNAPIEIEYKAYDNVSDLRQALAEDEVDCAFPVFGDVWYMEQQGYWYWHDRGI